MLTWMYNIEAFQVSYYAWFSILDRSVLSNIKREDSVIN